jgi:hypothetical protein
MNNLPESIEELIGQVQQGIRDGRFSDPADLKMTISEADRKVMRERLKVPYDFLRHADRNPDAELSEAEIDPLEAIMNATAAFSFAFPDRTLPSELHEFVERHGLKEQDLAPEGKTF